MITILTFKNGSNLHDILFIHEVLQDRLALVALKRWCATYTPFLQDLFKL